MNQLACLSSANRNTGAAPSTKLAVAITKRRNGPHSRKRDLDLTPDLEVLRLQVRFAVAQPGVSQRSLYRRPRGCGQRHTGDVVNERPLFRASDNKRRRPYSGRVRKRDRIVS